MELPIICEKCGRELDASIDRQDRLAIDLESCNCLKEAKSGSYDEGYEEGRRDGYDEGYEQGCEEVMAK